jgi:hypothetical protein
MQSKRLMLRFGTCVSCQLTLVVSLAQPLRRENDRLAVANPLVITALEGIDFATRQQALAVVQKVIERHPKSFGDNLLAAIDRWLDQSASEDRLNRDNEAHTLRSLQTRAITQMIAKLIETRTTIISSDLESRREADILLMACLLLFHHPYFGPASTQIWLDNAVAAGRDPAILAQSEMDPIMKMIHNTLQSESSVSHM